MKFHYIVRGIIRLEGKLLLAHQIGASNTFLPGGHIATGESAKTALIREIEEEFGLTAEVGRFVGAIESIWTDNQNHEINLLFEVTVPGLDPSQPPRSHEAHLEFIWSTLEDLQTHNLLPKPLIDYITSTDQDYEGFWGSMLD